MKPLLFREIFEGFTKGLAEQESGGIIPFKEIKEWFIKTLFGQNNQTVITTQAPQSGSPEFIGPVKPKTEPVIPSRYQRPTLSQPIVPAVQVKKQATRTQIKVRLGLIRKIAAMGVQIKKARYNSLRASQTSQSRQRWEARAGRFERQMLGQQQILVNLLARYRF